MTRDPKHKTRNFSHPPPSYDTFSPFHTEISQTGFEFVSFFQLPVPLLIFKSAVKRQKPLLFLLLHPSKLLKRLDFETMGKEGGNNRLWLSRGR